MFGGSCGFCVWSCGTAIIQVKLFQLFVFALLLKFLLQTSRRFIYFDIQVEKAFREGTARQNAHSIFVCLALKLLEERVHVACKEIITLEKQV